MSKLVQKLAVLIDADNVSSDFVVPLLDEIAKYEIISVKRIYGDWSSPQLDKWKEQLLPHAITPVQQFAYTKGKNATDMAIVIDAMDLLYSNLFDIFCIVSSDSDFTRLALRIRENGIAVYGFGLKKTPESLIKGCDKFIHLENLIKIEKAPPTSILIPIPKNTNSNTLKPDIELINLIKSAIEKTKDKDGWAPLGQIGTHIKKTKLDFNVKAYGHAKLSSLIKSINLFEIKSSKRTANIRIRPAPKT
ncbi:NYN domain-containing protein [Gilliamella sp. App6-5]|uniref:NYN domain-containing protein n=1 Tax=Gilliamella sp. App6-5 TaxID=3120232 RepID=UPI0009BE222E|nr:NYN domain-containing protein [Gilliamella apicola]